MKQKYEIFKENHNDKLYRIRALRDFGDVKQGDIGGFIENESNLSHDGNCWIYDNAQVCGHAVITDNAHIYGNAQVFGHTKVCGHAKVYDNAHIYGNVIVYGHAKVCGHAIVYDDAKVFDYAEVCNNAIIYDDANVCGTAKVYGYAILFRHATVCRGEITNKVIYMSLPKDDLTVQGDGYVKIGCECHHIDDWIEKYEEIGKKHDYSNDDIDLYGYVLKSLQKKININQEATK